MYTPTGKWRNCIERTNMVNNDEEFIITNEELLKINPTNIFNHGMLIFSRPIYNEELNNSELQRMLDDVYRFKQHLKLYEMLKNLGSQTLNASTVLAHIISKNYYDCMSGGCPQYLFQLLLKFANQPSIDKTVKVYPKRGEGDLWYTIQDFIDENILEYKELPEPILELAINNLYFNSKL